MVNDGDYYKGRACAYCSEPDVAKEYYHCPECDVMIKFGSWLVCLDLSAGNVGIAPINDLCHLFFFYEVSQKKESMVYLSWENLEAMARLYHKT